ncbi:Pkinase-domain-containing protein [Nadsonia fulvescens var. elongata DSM 6958]|uniref:non-specific serine/threonine protein kinase n=1 Tax=Nadsonia fulvescens var. elongata DSM 6958 TaxID=857566 RepID=A0A1E3PN59_9ASCO|nr:Pkinase-domain-containing protein [Nadsonia fulvescens var. elongata DSM 6958]
MGLVRHAAQEPYDKPDPAGVVQSPSSATGSAAFTENGTAASSASSTSSAFYASLNKYNTSNNSNYQAHEKSNYNGNIINTPPVESVNPNYAHSDLRSLRGKEPPFGISGGLEPVIPPPQAGRGGPPGPDDTSDTELDSDSSFNSEFTPLNYLNDNNSSSQSPATHRMLSRATSRAFSGVQAPPAQHKLSGASLSAQYATGNQTYSAPSPPQSHPLSPPLPVQPLLYPNSTKNMTENITSGPNTKSNNAAAQFSPLNSNNPFLEQGIMNQDTPRSLVEPSRIINPNTGIPFSNDSVTETTNAPSKASYTANSDHLPASDASNNSRLYWSQPDNDFNPLNQNKISQKIEKLQFESYGPSLLDDRIKPNMLANSTRLPQSRVNAAPLDSRNIQYKSFSPTTINTHVSDMVNGGGDLNDRIIIYRGRSNIDNISINDSSTNELDLNKTVTLVGPDMSSIARVTTPPPTEIVISKDVPTKQSTAEPTSPNLRASSAPDEMVPASKPSKPQKRRAIGDWDFVKSIGAGSMGQVKLAHNRNTGEYGAVKIVPISCSPQHRSRATGTEKGAKKKESDISKDTRTVREAAIGKLLHHRYICQLYDIYKMSSHYYMIFEYVSGGQMLDYIISHGSLKEKHAQKFARGIASALDYCHKNSIVHRDLKIENILISKSGEIKLIDFGLSNLFSNSTLLKTFCGSLYFAAPELLEAKPYTGPEIDVWSFGVVIFVLVCGKVPFDDQNIMALHAKIKQGRINYPEWLSTECHDLLTKMLNINPKERITLTQAMNHPWMVKGYGAPPDSYMPYRRPLSVSQLDPQIITEMAGFNFGSEEQVYTDMKTILNSAEYKYCCSVWESHDTHEKTAPAKHTFPSLASSSKNSATLNESNKSSLARHLSTLVRRNKPHRNHTDHANQDTSNDSLPPSTNESTLPSSSHVYTDPTAGFHPLLSVYYLVAERNQRDLDKKIIEEAKQFDVIYHSKFTSPLAAGDPVQSQDPTHPINDPFSNDHQIKPSSPSPRVNTNNKHLRSKSESKPQTSNYKASYKNMSPELLDKNNFSLGLKTSPDPSAGVSLISSPLKAALDEKYQPLNNINKYRGDFKSKEANETIDRIHIDTNAQAETNAHSTSLASSLLRRFSSCKKSAVAPEFGTPSSQDTKSHTRSHSSQDHEDESGDDTTSQNYGNNNRSNTTDNGHSIPDVPQFPTIYIPNMAEVKPATDNDSLNATHRDPFVQRSTSMSIPKNKKQAGVGEARKDNHLSPVVSGVACNSDGKDQIVHKPELRDADTKDKKYHPSARAKSASHIRRASVNRRYDENMGRPMTGGNEPGSKYYENFDIIDDYLDKNSYDGNEDSSFNGSNTSHADSGKDNVSTERKLSDEGLTKSNFKLGRNAQPISIDHPKQVFVRGIFSAQTTSTKSLAFIRADLIRVLSKLGISYREVQGGFQCSNTVTGDNLLVEPNIGHRRKFSFGSGLFGTPKSKGHHEPQLLGSPAYRRHSNEFSDDLSTDSITHNLSMGGSDMLSFSPIAAVHPDSLTLENDGVRTSNGQGRTPVRFEIYIVKVRIVSLHGIQFKKLSGNTWQYKAIASNILSELRL